MEAEEEFGDEEGELEVEAGVGVEFGGEEEEAVVDGYEFVWGELEGDRIGLCRRGVYWESFRKVRRETQETRPVAWRMEESSLREMGSGVNMMAVISPLGPMTISEIGIGADSSVRL